MLAARRVVLGALLPATVFFSVFGAAFHAPAPPATGADPSWMVALGEAIREHYAFGRDVIYTWGPLGYLDVPGVVPSTYAAKTLFALAIAGATGLIVLLRMRSEGAPWQRAAFVLGVLIVFPYANALYLAGEGDAQIFLLLVLLFTFPAFSQSKPIRLLAFSLGVLAGFLSLIKFSLYLSVLIVGLATCVVRVLQHKASPELRRADIEAAALYAAGFAASSAGLYYWFTYGFGYETALAIVVVAGALCWIAQSSQNARLRVIPIPAGACILIVVACSAVVLASAPYREFVYYSLQIVAGYSSAVSQTAHLSATSIALLFLFTTALLAIREAASLGAARLFAILSLLFIAFRQCFVRQDDTHMLPYFLVIAFIGCILLLSATQSRSSIYAAFLATLSLPIAFLVALSLPISPLLVRYGQSAVEYPLFPVAIADGLQGAFRTVAGWSYGSEILAANYKAGLRPDALAPSVRQKLGDEPVDLIGTETNVVFANDLKWRPRPAFQASYSVFTPSLDAMNRNSIRSRTTGRELLMYGSVDHKYPFGDEPMTSRELLCNYTIDDGFPALVATQGGDDLAILRWTPGRCGPFVPNASGTIGWNESLPVSTAPGRLAFLFIDFRYSALGRAARFLYHVAPVWMLVRYEGGATARYRVTPDLLVNGLLVNPIPRGMKDVWALFTGTPDDRVDTIRFTTASAWIFSPAMSYRIEELPYRRTFSRRIR